MFHICQHSAVRILFIVLILTCFFLILTLSHNYRIQLSLIVKRLIVPFYLALYHNSQQLEYCTCLISL